MIQVDTSMLAILVTVLISLVAFAFGYGILTNKVKNDRYDIEELKSCYKQIDEKLDKISTDVARIGAKLNGGQ